jgi:ABC-type transport system involved in cytochrome bd biosynthesis fused ATPase/permease subunit
MKANRLILALGGGLFLSICGVVVGGQSGTLLLALSGNLLTITAVYYGTRRNGNTLDSKKEGGEHSDK